MSSATPSASQEADGAPDNLSRDGDVVMEESADTQLKRTAEIDNAASDNLGDASDKAASKRRADANASADDDKGRSSDSTPLSLSTGNRRSGALISFANKVPRQLTRGEYARFLLSKLVPSSSFDYIDFEVKRLTNWVVPPDCDADIPMRLVGVPATEDSIRHGVHLRDEYGGLEAVQVLETLSDADMHDLEPLLGPGSAQNTLKVVSRPPSISNLVSMLSALTVQREMASLLGVFGPDRLAERTFNMVSFLKRLLSQYRHLRTQFLQQNNKPTQDMLQLRSRVDAVEREWTAMQAYWKSELEHMSAQKDDAEMRFEASIRLMSEEHQLELNKRDDKITELQDQLNTSEARCEILRRDMMEKKLSSWSFTDFLNQDPNVSITSNWQRLQGLFEHFVKRTKTPSSWISNINVLAVDDPRYVPGDYVVERKKAGDDDDEGSPLKTPPKTLDLSHSGLKSKGSKNSIQTPESRRPKKTRKSAAKESWICFKGSFPLRPSSRLPCLEYARSGTEELEWTEEVARGNLPGGLIPENSDQSSSDGDSPFDPETVDKEEEVDDAEGEAEVEYLKTDVLEEKPKSLTVLSSSDSEDSAPRSTPQRSSQNKRSKDSNSHSGSARKKARLNSKTNYLFISRDSTPLADIPFQDLSLEQLRKIEIVDPDITSSFRYFGIKMYFFGKKSKAQLQGFPNYAPQKTEIRYAQERWNYDLYDSLLPKRKNGSWIKKQLPWRHMFAERTKVFYYHQASKLSSAIMASLKKFVSFMEDHSQAWWELLHWITIDPDQDEESQVLYDGRRSRTDSLMRKHRTEVKRLMKIQGFPETLLQEPGIWPVPFRVCHWIWEDPRSVDKTGKRKPLRQQLMEVDEREPERTLWASAANEIQRTKHIPAKIRARTIPLPRRAPNRIVPGHPNNEIVDDDEETETMEI
ncbi:hypothetical protein PRIC1_010657 [Phytophthora ramorum]